MRKIIEDIKRKKERISIKPLVLNNLEFKNNTIEKFQRIPAHVYENKQQDNISKIHNYRKLSHGPILRRKKIKLRKILSILFLLSLFLGIIFWSSFLFEQVNVTIYKKTQNFNLEKETFRASKELSSDIPFEIMIVSDEKSEDIKLTKIDNVSSKSKGEVIFYNEFSKNTEKLIANTYISDENGKVYLTNKTISIPGYILKDDKIIPGEANVLVTSFLPGESYNGNPIDFTINSYKNTSKFKKIYAKAKTTFSGGASGPYYSLNQEDIKKLKDKTESFFKDSLISKVDSLIPKEYIFYPNAYNFSYEIDENTLSKIDEAKVNIKGTLSVVLLKKDDLKEKIIKKLIPEISFEELNMIDVDKMDKLVFSFIDVNQIVTKESELIDFNLSGELNFIWNPNISELKNNLLNIYKEDIPLVFKKDASIDNANVKIFPPWKNILPSDINKIKIKVF